MGPAPPPPRWPPEGLDVARAAGPSRPGETIELQPNTAFGIPLSVEIILRPIVGGAGTLMGPILGAFILDIVETVNRQGTTILLVEQNVRGSLRLCQRGYVLENGEIALAGSRDELVDSPRIRQAYLGM